MIRSKTGAYKDQYIEFIRLFALIGKDARLFPKKCKTCGKEYGSFPEYIHGTHPVKHCLEDCRGMSDAIGTMQYRNCPCGSTLIINFTKDVYPLMDSFWEMIGARAKELDRPVQEIVEEFREQCNRFVLEQKDR
jgi:hypothetical protein